MKSQHVERKLHDRRAELLPHGANVALAEVDDPLEHGARLLVLRSIRDDVLAAMHARGQLAAHQFAAGRAWQRLYEQAEIGGAQSIDPRKIRVDGRGPTTARDVRRLRAAKQLVRIDLRLGQWGGNLLHAVLVAGQTLRRVAAARGLDAQPGSSDLIYLGRRLRECLDTTAEVLGLVTHQRR